MYGMVNKGMRCLVVTHHGQGVWDRICARAEIDDVEFVGMKSYPDAMTYALVTAASEELNATPGELLELFGVFWIKFAAEEGFRAIFEMASDMMDMLAELDTFHTRLMLTMPELRMPSFLVQSSDATGAIISYASEREGLTPFVVGLLKGLGEYYGTPVEVEQMPSEPALGLVALFRVEFVTSASDPHENL